jgi:hypothetical protein
MAIKAITPKRALIIPPTSPRANAELLALLFIFRPPIIYLYLNAEMETLFYTIKLMLYILSAKNT